MDQFWKRVEKQADGCWRWTGARNPEGYGQIYLGQYRKQPAHRFAYEMLLGPIPEGLVLDHLCRYTSCVNPEHLEPVTMAENIRRGLVPDTNRARGAAVTHCRHGHPYDEENTYIRTNGQRDCRSCIRVRVRRYVQRKAAA